MATLTDDVKTYIVQALACFDTPLQVSDAVKQEFALDVPRSHVAMYQPDRKSGKNLSQKYRELFDATRKAFLEDASTIPIANQNFRLRALDRLYQNAASRGNAALAAQLIEQAAKESGGLFTNRREMTGKNGAPLIPQKSAQEMTDDELAAYIGASGARAMDSPQG
jgi:hypothetical protein